MRISDWSSDVCSSDLRAACSASTSQSSASLRRPCNTVHTISPRRSLGSSTSLVSRSEEHTSELQSLMRISYAVFCLKKQKDKKKTAEKHGVMASDTTSTSRQR